MRSLTYDGDLGAILAGASESRNVEVKEWDNRWKDVPAGTEIRLLLTITEETNNPAGSVGKTVSYTIQK